MATAARARLREGLSVGNWLVVCNGVLDSTVSVGKLSSALLCKLRCLLMPRWGGIVGTGIATVAVSVDSWPGVVCTAVLCDIGLKICTTTLLMMRCTGQYRLISHSAIRCAAMTVSQTSRLRRVGGYWAWNSLAMGEFSGLIFAQFLQISASAGVYSCKRHCP